MGAVLSGAFADAWGRKKQVVIGTLMCAISSGLIAFIPNGSWFLFAILRFFVGTGLSAAVTPSVTIVVEFTPTRHRTMATSFYLVFFSAGGLIAPIVSAAVMGSFGWRGVASLGFVALIIGILVWIYTPKSVRWLAAKGRLVEAQAEVARHLSLPLNRVSLPNLAPIAQPSGNLLDLLSQPRIFLETILIWGGSSIAMYGVYLWGPTIVALLLGVSVPQAAAFFIFVAGAGVFGKIAVTFLAPVLGRRRLGIIWGFGGAAALAVAGYENAAFIAEVPLMIVLLRAANFCVKRRLALLWQIFSGTGFPNQFFNDSWVVGFWRADHGRHNVELGRRASRMAQAVLGSPGP